jgi:hypothetical protein
MPTYGIVNVGTGAQPIWYGSPTNPAPFTIANTSASANIWIGNNQSVGPVNPNESTVITPGGFLSLDGSQSVYYVVADAANGEVTIYPGVTSYFLPVSLSGLGGASVYMQTTQPTGTIAPNSLWINTTTGGIEVYSDSIWTPVQFNADALLEVQTIVANLIAAGTIVAGIVNGTVVEGARLVAYGSTGEVLVYSGTPASGNLAGSWSGSAGNDGLGNSWPEGLIIGSNASNTPQVALVPAPGGPNSPAQLQFPLSPASLFGNQPNIGADSPSSNGELFISGPGLAQSGFKDWLQFAFYSYTNTTPAHLDTTYSDGNDVTHVYQSISYFGVNLYACNFIQAVEPGTGTSQTNAASGENFHEAALENGWVGSGGGVNALFYQLLPWGVNGVVEIIGDIQNSTATGNSVCATLPTGYQPTSGQNHPAFWNNPTSSNSASPPWVNVQSNGNIQITAIEVANKEIFFHIFVPLGL